MYGFYQGLQTSPPRGWSWTFPGAVLDEYSQLWGPVNEWAPKYATLCLKDRSHIDTQAHRHADTYIHAHPQLV